MALTPEALYVAPADGRNLPLPDELNEIRLEIKRLETREEELRLELIAHPEWRTGANWVAKINKGTRQQFDQKEMKAAHPDIAAQHTHPVPTTTIELLAVTEDGELVSARKFRKLQAAEQE